ncbi:MAG: response regulator [Chloroflexota bacterium]
MEQAAMTNPVRILIVDDHPNTATMLARVLSRFDTPVEVLTACSGDDALAQLGSDPVDVLITDFMMPGMNGLELIERLKGSQKPSHTILITAYDTPGLVITARRLNVHDYLVKPVQPEKIRSIVVKAIEDLRPKAVAPSPIPAAQRSFKILIADDYPDNLRLLSTRLQSEGYTFMAAWDGEEALRKVYEEDPDLVLLDVNMPKKDGFQVLAQMRADPKIAHIPVIMITAARIGPRDVREGLTLGADDYVIKPFDWRELAARIHSKLRVKHAEDILRRRTRELGILPEIGQELSAQLDIDALADVVVNRTCVALAADAARLDLYQPDGSVYSRLRSLDQPGPLSQPVDRDASLRWGVNQLVVTARQGVVIDNARLDSRWQPGGERAAAAVAVPLLGRQRVVGVLTLYHSHAGYFNNEHQALLQAIASQAAIALENAQLFDVEHRRVEEMMALNEISQEINRCTHSSQLLESLPRLVQERLGYPIVAVWNGVNDGVDELRLCSMVGASHGLDADQLLAAPQQARTGGCPVLVSETGQAPSVAAVPLLADGRLRGVLSIYSPAPGAFQESDIALLQTLATQVVAALDRVALFESVEHEQRRLLAVLRSAADAILMIDQANRLTLANPAGECLFSDCDALGDRPLPTGAGYDPLLQLLDQARAGGSHRQAEIAWPDGRTFAALVTPIEEGGQVVVMHDISRFKVLAELKNEYIATASHDLKNPIMSVMGYNDLLAKAGPLNEMQTEFTRRIHGSALQMRDLVLNLLEISRLESGQALKLEPIDLAVFLEAAAAGFRDQAGQKSQALLTDFAPGPLAVRADALLLQQMVNNLLSNAVKYTPPGGRITLSAHPAGRQVELRFADTGIGIAAHELPRLFQKFYRVENDDTREIEGTGLGLAIVKSIAENHGGQVRVESRRGEGTTFIVTLPALG